MTRALATNLYNTLQRLIGRNSEIVVGVLTYEYFPFYVYHSKFLYAKIVALTQYYEWPIKNECFGIVFLLEKRSTSCLEPLLNFCSF